MIKYAKIENEKTKQCSVGLGDQNGYFGEKNGQIITIGDYYKSMGMTEQDVEECWDGNWYLSGYCPQKPSKTYDDIKNARIQYRKEHIDNQTLERQRKQANGTWTEEDEQLYLALDSEVTAYIEENLPYPVE